MAESNIGRPTSMTPEVVMKLEQAFAIDASVEEACSYADISRNTFYVWLEKNPDYKDRINELRTKPVLKARQTVVKSLDTPASAQWYLSRKAKKEFAERVENTGAEGKDLMPDNDPIIQELTDKLNELYKSTDGTSDGELASLVGPETPNKE